MFFAVLAPAVVAVTPGAVVVPDLVRVGADPGDVLHVLTATFLADVHQTMLTSAPHSGHSPAGMVSPGATRSFKFLIQPSLAVSLYVMSQS